MGDSTPAASAKAELRRSMRDSRRARLLENDDAKNDVPSDVEARLADRVLDLPEVRAACAQGRAIACYTSRADEPPTALLRDRLLRAGAILLLPRIDGTDLQWILVTPDTTWATNRWGIAEPQGAASAQAPAVWIIPALAIDADGYRLGQGGGFYDRALEHISGDAPIIGIVFDDEVPERVPREEHDIRVDVVVTPERTLVVTTSE